jgi:predicted naringenin-chalcone synthase
MSLILTGFGTSVPEHSIAQADAAEIGTRFAALDPKRARTVRAIYRKAGVHKRHSVLLESAEGAPMDRLSFYEDADGPDDAGPSTEQRMRRYEAEAPKLAEAAARGALQDAALAPKEITHIVTVSCTGFFSPGLDAVLIEQLGLSPGVARSHVGFMGCHGALNGLRVASSFVGANPNARVLLAAVELCTLHFAYGRDPQLMVANALFSDGAAAVVGVSHESSDAGAWRVLATGSLLMPDSADAMSWRIGDHGFRMTLSATVPNLIAAHLCEWLEQWLGQHGLGVGDVASWAMHPGGPRLLSAVSDAVELTRDAMEVSREVLAEYGNMSSATVLFILDRLRQRDAPRPCVALAFGPGLVVEAVLFG